MNNRKEIHRIEEKIDRVIDNHETRIQRIEEKIDL